MQNLYFFKKNVKKLILPQAITDGLRPGVLAPFRENGSRPLSYEAFLVVLFPARYFLMHSTGMLTIYTYHQTKRGGRMVPYNNLWANSPGRGRKRKESLQLCLWNLNICIEKVDVKCWVVEMTVTTSFPLACVFHCLFTLFCAHFRFAFALESLLTGYPYKRETDWLRRAQTLYPPPPLPYPHFLKFSKWNVGIHLIFQLECLVMPSKW